MQEDAAGASAPRRRLYVYNGGFLTQTRIRRILALRGWEVRLGKPGPGDAVGVWGQSPTAPRGEAVAGLTGAPVVRVEDAFLRSLFPGRAGDPTLGLLIDETGVHFDAAAPSDLETLLATHPLDDPALLVRARTAIDALRRAHLSKFAATDPALPVPEPGFVLVLDQTRGDAAVAASGGDRAAFRAMLDAARAEHPGRRIVVKTHPETAQGHRGGHFDATDGAETLTAPVSPWRLYDAAHAVYTLSSGAGFEAILAGRTPQVFGTPFYAGWGLTADRGAPLPRRGRKLTSDQLAAAALILYPAWYDPFHDRLCGIEEVIRTLGAQARAWRDDRAGWRAHGMSRWKHPHLRAFFGTHGGIAFSGPQGRRREMVWASATRPGETRTRIEDGFLRSRGLGARLTPPLSLVLDDLGIYYDPTRESRLERLIAESPTLPLAEIERARALVARIRALGLSKYNIGAAPPAVPPGRKILVVGQVEDDASILKGAGKIATNAALLELAARENPGAELIYKPHPDVEAGLRRGALDRLPDRVIAAPGTSAPALIDAVDEVWTMTSLLGFEALLRGKPVTVTGAPFYAGWGLTRDLGEIPARRSARPTLEALAHAALIGYPRYRDPVTGLACPPEIAVDRLASGATPPPRGLLARLQPLRRWLRRPPRSGKDS